MVKFYKPGKIVVITKGRYAGRKALILKSNYENTKERKYPHCLVCGLSKGPRKATKRSLKKVELQIRNLEAKQQGADTAERLNKLKRLGVFIKTYNMSHLLVTRYTVQESFGTEKFLTKIDTLESSIKDLQTSLNQKEHDKEKDKMAKDIEQLKTQIGVEKDNYKNTLRECKGEIGTEMHNRFMQGFVASEKNEAEKQSQTQFLFKKLTF